MDSDAAVVIIFCVDVIDFSVLVDATGEDSVDVIISWAVVMTSLTVDSIVVIVVAAMLDFIYFEMGFFLFCFGFFFGGEGGGFVLYSLKCLLLS